MKMYISKKAISILLSALLAISPFAGTAAFAADSTGSSTSNVQTNTQVNKQNLKAAIEKAGTIEQQGNTDGKYTSDSWQKFEVALEAAKADNENQEVDQQQVDTDTEALNSAIDGLTPASTKVNKTKLQAAIQSASKYTDGSLYTSDSWQKFEAALEAAKADNENQEVDQQKVDTDTEALNSAIDGLTPASIKVNKTKLQAAIQSASKYTDGSLYTSDSWQKFEAALEAAKADNENQEVDQQKVDTDTEALNSAMKGLVLVKPVTKITLPTNVDRIVGTTSKLHVTFTPFDATDKSLSWISSDPTVATIDKVTGIIKALKVGKTTITATTSNQLSTTCTLVVMTEAEAEQDAKDSIKNLPDLSSTNFTEDQKNAIIEAVDDVTFTQDPVHAVGMDAINKLEALLEKITAGTVSEKASTLDTNAISNQNDKIVEAPTVSNLFLASGVMGDEDASDGLSPIALGIKQLSPIGSGSVLAFQLTLTDEYGDEVSDLYVPVTVKFKLPKSFVYNSGYTYTVRHDKEDGTSETLPLTISGGYGMFTTSSFSEFTIVETKKTDSGSHHSDSSSHSSGSTIAPIITQSATYTSDTTADFSVNGTYQFKITSTNGRVPTFVIGTPGVFSVEMIQKSGNDYFFKIIAIGTPGAKAGIYVNGQKLLVATVTNKAINVKCDTTKPFFVKTRASYTFKLTASTKPVFICGNGSVFTVKYVGSKSNDYFFKVIAVGKAGASAGFYINGSKTPCTIATVH